MVQLGIMRIQRLETWGWGWQRGSNFFFSSCFLRWWRRCLCRRHYCKKWLIFRISYKKLQITNFFRKLLLLSSIFKAFPDKTIYVKKDDEFWRITTNFDVLFLQFANNWFSTAKLRKKKFASNGDSLKSLMFKKMLK